MAMADSTDNAESYGFLSQSIDLLLCCLWDVGPPMWKNLTGSCVCSVLFKKRHHSWFIHSFILWQLGPCLAQCRVNRTDKVFTPACRAKHAHKVRVALRVEVIQHASFGSPLCRKSDPGP